MASEMEAGDIEWLEGQRRPLGIIGANYDNAHNARIERILSALNEAREQPQQGWRPISEAPHACHVLACRFDDCEWTYAVVQSPPSMPFTHFRQLPEPPLPAPSDGGL